MPCLLNVEEAVIPVDDALASLVTRAVEHALATVRPGPLLKGVLPDECLVPGALAGWQVSVTLVDDEAIAELNETWLGHAGPTDVISFSQLEGEAFDASLPAEARLLGDVVVSVETAKRQSAEYGHAWEWELAFLAVHGVLHLLGYDDHEEADRGMMIDMQEKIVSQVSSF